MAVPARQLEADARRAPAAGVAPGVAPAPGAAPQAQTRSSGPDTPAPARRPAADAGGPARRVEPAKPKRLLTPAFVFGTVMTALFIFGWFFPTERYITPKRGMGYWLGIVGGSLMLLLFLYSARKRVSWLRWMGAAPRWFQFHMVCGVLGPLLILYHSNYRTGASNSNVALYSMLIVAGSGLVGRYIYAHIHHGLYGHKLTLGELRSNADGLKVLSGTVGFLPELISRLEAAEQRILTSGPTLPILGFARPLVVNLRGVLLRWRLHTYVRRALRIAARGTSSGSRVIATERKRLGRTACGYIDRRLAATARVASLQGYERMFSLWHALHLPLIFMLLVAGIVHVIAVHVY